MIDRFKFVYAGLLLVSVYACSMMMSEGERSVGCKLFGSTTGEENTYCLMLEMEQYEVDIIDAAIGYALNNHLQCPAKNCLGNTIYLNCATFTNDVIIYLTEHGFDIERLQRLYTMQEGIKHVSLLIDGNTVIDIGYGKIGLSEFRGKSGQQGEYEVVMDCG
jgi:hypothetical protein